MVGLAFDRFVLRGVVMKVGKKLISGVLGAVVGLGGVSAKTKKNTQDPPSVNETLTKRSKKIRAKVEENKIKRDKRIVGARIDDKASSVKSWSTEEKALVGAGIIGTVAVVGGAGAAIYNRDKIKRYFKLSKLRNLKKKIWADFKLKVVCYNYGTMGKYIEFCIVSKGSNGLFEEISTFSLGMFDKDLKDNLVSKVNSVLLDFVKSHGIDCSDDIVGSLAASLVSRDVDFSSIEEVIGGFKKLS